MCIDIMLDRATTKMHDLIFIAVQIFYETEKKTSTRNNKIAQFAIARIEGAGLGPSVVKSLDPIPKLFNPLQIGLQCLPRNLKKLCLVSDLQAYKLGVIRLFCIRLHFNKPPQPICLALQLDFTPRRPNGGVAQERGGAGAAAAARGRRADAPGC